MAYWHWTLGNTKVQKKISDFGKTPPYVWSRVPVPPPPWCLLFGSSSALAWSLEFEIPQLLGVPLKTHASGPRLGLGACQYGSTYQSTTPLIVRTINNKIYMKTIYFHHNSACHALHAGWHGTLSTLVPRYAHHFTVKSGNPNAYEAIINTAFKPSIAKKIPSGQ